MNRTRGLLKAEDYEAISKTVRKSAERVCQGRRYRELEKATTMILCEGMLKLYWRG